MPGLQAGVETPLLGGRYRFFAGAEAVALGDEGRRRRIVRRQRDGQRVVGGERAEGSAEQRVRSCREHRQAVVLALAEPLDPETEGGALGAADPLALHEAHFFGPAIEPRDRKSTRLNSSN